MNPNSNYITAEKRKELEVELHDLQTSKRREILDALEFAKSLGDLSENAEYHQAREEQGKLEERIAVIENILQNSTIIKKHHSTKVEVGATITVQKEGEKNKQTFQIVGSEEADFASGKISNKSPLGMALYGKEKGDTATFTSPKGPIKYKVISID
ncbi:MAG: transcription elongation factor GreA [Candidatus Pacebacteria bacterium]|nr:transcription elongation factor GreA [Candidatus Paceibacterota bacterium]